MIQVYTGTGKGKTTAALGLAVRAKGAGWRVVLVRFLKGESSSELAALAGMGMTVITASPYLAGFYKDLSLPDQGRVKEDTRAAFLAACQMVEQGKADLLILDELAVAVSLGLLPEDEVIFLCRAARKKGIELVITGRGASLALMAEADLVTEMREVKHPFNCGFPARRGIEF